MFDRTIEKVATGAVVRWTFNNPHSWLYLNVKDKTAKKRSGALKGPHRPHFCSAGSPAPRSNLAKRSPSFIVP
jgi:hypothetical protein